MNELRAELAEDLTALAAKIAAREESEQHGDLNLALKSTAYQLAEITLAARMFLETPNYGCPKHNLGYVESPCLCDQNALLVKKANEWLEDVVKRFTADA